MTRLNGGKHRAPGHNAGLWGVGDLRVLLREGAPVDGKTFKTIHVLKAVAGRLGVTRGFNDHGQAVALVGFTTGSSAIVRVAVPWGTVT